MGRGLPQLMMEMQLQMALTVKMLREAVKMQPLPLREASPPPPRTCEQEARVRY